ncbi:MAG: cysteine--tRNA ligase [Nanoarchaeota archaeon]
MALQLFNSLTRKKETFTPVKDNVVRIYSCGPTVYNDPHIGNFRYFVFSDVLRRYLKFRGYDVAQVMNITDVGHMTSEADEGEDKLEVAAKKESLDPWKIAEKYTSVFLEAVDALGMERVEWYPRATEHVQEMIAITQRLLDVGFAYEAGGNVYFDVAAFEEYGKLSGNTLEKLESQGRAVNDENKRNPQDFVLWFANSKYKNHIMKWDSPWGEGYPGWHIECTAMSMRYLSEAFDGNGFNPERFETIDIHTGGEDNKFPHHESEIAQTEGATGKQFSQFWMHVRHLMAEGEKMSKSLGNFYTVQQLLDEGYSAHAIRYELLSTHYRQQMNFTREGLEVADKSLQRVQEAIFTLQHIESSEGTFEANVFLEDAEKRFVKAMDDDINVSGALAVLFDLVKVVNKSASEMSGEAAGMILRFLQRIDTVFNVMDFSAPESIDEEIQEMIDKREKARAEKDWQTADRIRDDLQGRGIELIDTDQGTRWKRV